MKADDEFYIGYLAKGPPATARFVRRTVAGLVAGGLALGLGAAGVLPFRGDGRFEFGQPGTFRGTYTCGPGEVARLRSAEAEFLVVSFGKHGAPVEWCGGEVNGSEVAVTATRAVREGRQLLEVVPGTVPAVLGPGEAEPAAVALGRHRLRGEIVDAKCYFGVMNPGEGRVHRACAVQCLRGGIPAVFVVRDRTGATAHLLVAGPDGRSLNRELLRWVGEPVEGEGEVVQQGRWRVWRLEPSSLRVLTR